jgi:hypothetical protein
VRTGTLRWLWIGGLLATAGLYAWWATSLRPFTRPSLAVVPAGGLVAMAFGATRLPPRRPLGAPPRYVGVWAVIAAVLVVWQLATFLQHPRAEHPTISSLANTGFESHPVRALALLLWLLGAAALARR